MNKPTDKLDIKNDTKHQTISEYKPCQLKHSTTPLKITPSETLKKI